MLSIRAGFVPWPIYMASNLACPKGQDFLVCYLYIFNQCLVHINEPNIIVYLTEKVDRAVTLYTRFQDISG